MQERQYYISLARVLSEAGNQMSADQESRREVQFYFSQRTKARYQCENVLPNTIFVNGHYQESLHLLLFGLLWFQRASILFVMEKEENVSLNGIFIPEAEYLQRFFTSLPTKKWASSQNSGEYFQGKLGFSNNFKGLLTCLLLLTGLTLMLSWSDILYMPDPFARFPIFPL